MKLKLLVISLLVVACLSVTKAHAEEMAYYWSNYDNACAQQYRAAGYSEAYSSCRCRTDYKAYPNCYDVYMRRYGFTFEQAKNACAILVPHTC